MNNSTFITCKNSTNIKWGIKEERRSTMAAVVRPWPAGHSRRLLLHLADDVSGDGWVEVDGVVTETLRCFVALAAAALEGLAHSYLGSVAVLGVILDPIYIL